MNTERKIRIMLTGSFLLLVGVFMNVAIAGAGNFIEFKEIKNLELKVPEGLTQAKILMAIKYGLLEENWEFDKGTDKEVAATLNIRTHQLKYNLFYDTSSIRFVYTDSENLNYKKWEDNNEFSDFPDGAIVIHKSSKLWLEAVIESINSELKRMLVSEGLL